MSLSGPFTEDIWSSLFYKIVRLCVSIVVIGVMFSLKTHPRHGLKGVSTKKNMVRSGQIFKATTEWSRVQDVGYRQKPRQNLRPVARTNMVGIKAGLQLSRRVGSKFTLVVEDTKFRTASQISVTFCWVGSSGQFEGLSAQLSRVGRGCPQRKILSSPNNLDLSARKEEDNAILSIASYPSHQPKAKRWEWNVSRVRLPDLANEKIQNTEFNLNFR